MEDKEIRVLQYSTGGREVVGTNGVTSIRETKDSDEMIAGSEGYLTTYVVERYGKFWKIVPGWMVTVEFVM